MVDTSIYSFYLTVAFIVFGRFFCPVIFDLPDVKLIPVDQFNRARLMSRVRDNNKVTIFFIFNYAKIENTDISTKK